MGARAPPRTEKNWGGHIHGKLYVHPRQRVHPPRQSKSPIFLGNWGDLGGGRGYLGSFSVCFESDD